MRRLLLVALAGGALFATAETSVKLEEKAARLMVEGGCEAAHLAYRAADGRAA